jgi:ATP-dependent Lhr-like helicase
VGDLTDAEIRQRASEDPTPWLAELDARGRVVTVRVAGELRRVAVEDVARYRDALGVQPPLGIAAAHLEAVAQPLESLAMRWARTHGPFTAADLARRLGLLPAQVEPALRALISAGRLLEGAFLPGQSGTEYCDADVLRLIRRETLARLRNQVAPVEAAVLARFLPRWHGIGGARGGLPRLREVLEQLEGLALPWSELERAILPARVPDFSSRMLDELGALGELVWIGQGALGSDDGRVALYRRERVATLHEPVPKVELTTPLHERIYTHLETRGASFFAQLRALDPGASEREVDAALWDLAWAGLITNDTFAPLRLLGRPLPRRGSLPAGGRWSAVSQLHLARPDETTRAHGRALALLERWGVVSREAATVEGLAGGFAQVAPVLRALEEAGRVRRGYFVEGLTGVQYAHAGAVDRLRAARSDEAHEATTLSAVDPANPYGALLPWPGESPAPRRVAGARLILVDGLPVFYLEKGGKKLRFFPAAEETGRLDAALAELRNVARSRRHGQLHIAEVDGEPALRSRHLPRLTGVGFRLEPNGIVLGKDR